MRERVHGQSGAKYILRNDESKERRNTTQDISKRRKGESNGSPDMQGTQIQVDKIADNVTRHRGGGIV